MSFDEAFLKKTIEIWQNLSPEPLTEADGQEIAESMTGLFSTLARCARERKTKKDVQLDNGSLHPDNLRMVIGS